MLTQGEDVEAHALKERGWSISAIARHLDRDRKTVRAYLNGDRQPGVRVTVGARSAGRFEAYLRARFADDPHLWATALFDEVVALGYDRAATRRSCASSASGGCVRIARRAAG